MVPFSLDRLMQMKLFLLTLPTVVWYVIQRNEREKMAKAKAYKKDLEDKDKEAEEVLNKDINDSTPLLGTPKTGEALLLTKSNFSIHSETKSTKNSTKSNAYMRITKDPNGKFIFSDPQANTFY